MPQSNSWSIKDWEIHLSNITRSAVMNMNYDNLASSTLLSDLKAMLKDWKREHQEYEMLREELHSMHSTYDRDNE